MSQARSQSSQQAASSLRTKKLLSDHMPFIAKNKDISLIGWNMLCQMKFHPKWEFFNNGFICPNETDEQYNNRLLHIAAKLNVAAAREKPAFICLQECPESLASRDTFVKALKKGELQDYTVNFYNNDDDEYYLMTLHDTRQYSVVPQLSNLMAKIALTEGLQERVLPLVFASHKTGEPWLVVNVHANFSKEVQHDVSALYQSANRLGIINVVLLGDFNRDLVLESDDYSKHDISRALSEDYFFEDGLRVIATHGASFCTQYKKDSEQKKQRLETRDGVMSTCKLYVELMANMNEADLSLSFIKEISPHLATIPDRFLEKLSLKTTNDSCNQKHAIIMVGSANATFVPESEMQLVEIYDPNLSLDEQKPEATIRCLSRTVNRIEFSIADMTGPRGVTPTTADKAEHQKKSLDYFYADGETFLCFPSSEADLSYWNNHLNTMRSCRTLIVVTDDTSVQKIAKAANLHVVSSAACHDPDQFLLQIYMRDSHVMTAWPSCVVNSNRLLFFSGNPEDRAFLNSDPLTPDERRVLARK